MEAVIAAIAGKFSKIAVRVAIIVAIVGLILIALATISIPTPDFTVVTESLGKVLALVYHWVPSASVIVPIFTGILGVSLAVITVEILIIGSNFLLKSVGGD